MKLLSVILLAGALGALTAVHAAAQAAVVNVTSKDGTRIAVECAGSGPTLLIVHGGTGDRTRWTPLFQYFSPRLTVCAMDRRAHGASGDSPEHSLAKEAEDVAAVVNSRAGTVYVLGHSYGGVAALEASFLTNRIARLILYEPPLQDLDHAATAKRMGQLLEQGNRDAALVAFFEEIVMISPAEITAMKTRPSWPALLASVETLIRQDRALAAYRFVPERMRTMQVPTLLLSGSRTASPQLRQAIDSMKTLLPHAEHHVFEGQEHNAMDTVPRQFADRVLKFVLPD